MLITVGDIVSIASIFKVGASLGASLDEIKSNLPAITKQALDINAELTKLQTMPQMSQTLQIDLSVARDKEPQDVSGDHIQAMDITGDLYVRFNQADSENYNVNKTRRLNVPFDKIFLSNTAQAGKVATLVLGKGGLFQIQDVSPTEINIIASEVTLEISITSSTIMMPIDIQSSYIMMPIDIQAQYMDLAIDIVAQSIGNIKMDIAAQSIGKISISLNVADIVGSIPIDIKAQTVGNIKMDMAAQSIGNVAVNIAGQIANVTISLAAQSVGIFLQQDWTAKEGTDKNYWNSEGLSAATEDNLWLGNIAAGTKLLISDWTLGVRAVSTTTHLLVYGQLYHCKYDGTGIVSLASCGGNGGFSIVFNKPKTVYDASNNRKLYAYIRNMHPTLDYAAVEVNAGGYTQ